MNYETLKILKNTIQNNEQLSKEFIQQYIVELTTLYQAETSLKRILFSKSYGYDDDSCNLYIAPTYFGERQKYFLKIHHQENNQTLKTLFTLYMIHHEIGHVLQTDCINKERYLDMFFKEELKKSLFLCELDIKYLNKLHYSKYHDQFLFEANANIFALLANDILLQTIDSELNIELYNQYAASIITHAYHNNICPIVRSDYVCQMITKELHKINPNIPIISLDQNPYIYIKQDLKTTIEKGYPIDKNTYQQFLDIAKGKMLTKSLFNDTL